MGPFVFCKAENAPKHAQRLDGAGGFSLAHVGRLPAELIVDLANYRLGLVVVAANEHGRLAAFVFRIDHPGIADGVVCLDEMRVGEGGLQALHQRLVEAGEKLQHAVDRRRLGDRIGSVDHRLACQITGARRLERVGRDAAFDRQHDDLAKLGGVGKARRLRSLVLRDEILELAGVARAENDLMAVFDKASGKRFSHVAGAENADFHGFLPATMTALLECSWSRGAANSSRLKRRRALAATGPRRETG